MPVDRFSRDPARICPSDIAPYQASAIPWYDADRTDICRPEAATAPTPRRFTQSLPH